MPYHHGVVNQVVLDLHRVQQDRRWRDKGQLTGLYDEPIKATMVEAINALDEAYEAKDLYDDKKRQEKYDREQKARDEERNPNVRERIRG